MSEHLTLIREVDGEIGAYCPEHIGVGNFQAPTRQGLNAVVTEARAHDDIVHGVYRGDAAYRDALTQRRGAIDA